LFGDDSAFRARFGEFVFQLRNTSAQRLELVSIRHIERTLAQLTSVGVNAAQAQRLRVARNRTPSGRCSAANRHHIANEYHARPTTRTTLAKILCATDLSPASKSAFEYALALAEQADAQVELLHVVEIPAELPENGRVWLGGEPYVLFDLAKDHAQERLSELLDGVAPSRRARVTAEVVGGHAVATIVELSQAHQCDLIVLGKHGRSALGDVFLGNVAHRVLRRAQCPVLVVPTGTAWSLEKILVGVDFSEDSVAALSLASWFGKQFTATVDVTHVWTQPLPLPQNVLIGATSIEGQTLEEYVRVASEKELVKFVHEQRAKGHAIDRYFLEVGEPSSRIISRAREENHNLIVVGTHGRLGLSRFFLGSVAERVIQRSTLPVLGVRAAGHAAA
jgi:nucleotide-binding universal stress UspA family protein